MKKVLNTTEFVLWMIKQPVLAKDAISPHEANLKRISRYAWLMQTPLSLSMFIPCDKKGELAENPEDKMYGDSIQAQYAWSNYRGALGRVLFEGWEFAIKEGIRYWLNYNNQRHIAFWESPDKIFELKKEGRNLVSVKNIEDLARQTDLTPTSNLLKLIGLTDNKDKQD